MAFYVNGLPCPVLEQNWPRRDCFSVMMLNHNAMQMGINAILHDFSWYSETLWVLNEIPLSFYSAAMPNPFIFLETPPVMTTVHILTNWPHFLFSLKENEAVRCELPPAASSSPFICILNPSCLPFLALSLEFKTYPSTFIYFFLIQDFIPSKIIFLLYISTLKWFPMSQLINIIYQTKKIK